MKQENLRVDFDTMQRFVTDVFKGVGVPDKDAEICADVLITADKRGIFSHGINRLKNIYYDRIRAGIQNPVTKFQVLREGPTTAVVDGNNGMGQVIASKAMDLAIKKACEYGMGMVAVRNSTHYGIAGYYVMQACRVDMIGISGTNARPSVAPTFGVENMLGTNPLTFGMPSDEEFPFVIDCATSIAQRGKIEAYAKMGKSLPSGWVIGNDGKPRTDPEEVLEGLTKDSCALTPLGGIGEETGGYKGYGYSTVVEILSAALQGGCYLRMLSDVQDGKKVSSYLGHFFIAINISSFIEPGEFKKITGNILRSLRDSKKAPGEKRIYTAGEKEHLYWLENREKGIPLNQKLQEEIKVMQRELGLKGYEFPF